MALYQCNWVAVLTMFHILPYLSASAGDQSPFFRNCFTICLKNNCKADNISYTKEGIEQLETTNPLIVWGCGNECIYNCMWRTVEAFEKRGFAVPKFYGKWPFKRILGIQEPAAAFASFLNLVAHTYMLIQYLRHFPKADDLPIIYFWHFFFLMCMNAWLWSIIFHTSDRPFTEFMDYAGALSMVVAMYVAAIIRVLHKWPLVMSVVGFSSVSFSVDHMVDLLFKKVDYEYNMQLNMFYGVLGSAIWLVWGSWQLWQGRQYAWRLIAFVALTGAGVWLEVLDFPPQYGMWDAHALWHLATVPQPLLFYRFIIDDLYHMKEQQSEDKSKTA